ncbi:MAG: GNAT family N-acetyltransferase [Gammaproteobacteria bacterium]|nr:GNAT family N-acetyltransferase [Gammaproteobacteria bacterium]
MTPRDYPIFRPYWCERPTELLGDSITEEDLDWIRIAKHNGDVIAAYWIEQHDPFNFTIKSFAVDKVYRKQGLGRWMVLHAVGLIESKGGRTAHAQFDKPVSFLETCGFTCVEPGRYVMELTPD